MSSQVAVDLEHLSFAYEQDLVLRDVSARVMQGEFIGIIGPNGGGKTTLLKLIMGALTPSSGSVKIFGFPPSAMLSRIAYVPQTLGFDRQFPISVLETVLMGRLSKLTWYGRYRQEDLSAAQEALFAVGLQDTQERAFGTLSGGQAQRVLIARALVSHPDLLILDEPTAGVDVQTQQEIYKLLKTLCKDKTILMVTHDLNIAISHVHRVLCVQQQLYSLMPQEVCEHFALGLYHAPLTPLKTPTAQS